MDKKQFHKLVSLDYGRCYSDKLIYYLIFNIIICSLMIPLLIYFVIAENELSVLAMAPFILLGEIVFIYLLIILINIRKEFHESCKDMVRLTAEAYSSDSNGMHVWKNYISDMRLTVEFYYKDNIIRKTSGKPGLKRPLINYYKIFDKYDGKRIDIFYSPNRDTVFIIK